jgi:8-oxo-dGTP diphosphatase
MPLARFVAFHPLPEPEDQASALAFAVMLASSRHGFVLVFNRYRKVWELPGGLIDAGETPRQAAERELAEEAGCHARATRWLGVVEVNDGEPHFGAVFRCDVDSVPGHFENEETAGIALWHPDTALQPLGHSDAELLAKFA